MSISTNIFPQVLGCCWHRNERDQILRLYGREQQQVRFTTAVLDFESQMSTCVQVSQRTLEISQRGAQSKEGITTGHRWVGDNIDEGVHTNFILWKLFWLYLVVVPPWECWLTLLLQDIPQQMNGSDCGMFACKFSEYLSRYDETMNL